MRAHFLLVTTALLLLCTSAHTTELPLPPSEALVTVGKWELTLGPKVTLYLPGSAKTRARFGGSWSNLGLTVGLRPQAEGTRRRSSRLLIDVAVIRQERGPASVVMVPLGVGYRAFDTSLGAWRLYGGPVGELIAIDLRSPVDGVDSGLCWRPGLGLVTKAVLTPHWTASLRYVQAAAVDDFNLSGAHLSLGASF